MLTRTEETLLLLALSILPACAPEVASTWRSTLPPAHDIQVEHTFLDILHESGLAAKRPALMLEPNSNYFVGTVRLDYDPSFGPMHTPFRMALMIYTNEGKLVEDYFDGITIETDDIGRLGKGNARLPVPRVYSHSIQIRESVRIFSERFPDWIDRDFELTFKKFDGHSYFLENVPGGTAFVWFQTGFDGSRVMQFPLIVPLEPSPGAIKRLDIRIRQSYEEFPFHTL